MKTPIDTINSTIIVPNRVTDGAETTQKNALAQADRTPRAHIIDRRAQRWARRAAH